MHKFRFIVLVAGLFLAINISAKEDQKEDKKEKLYFTVIKELPCTSVKDQYRSGTCWAFSTLGFIEAELLRLGMPEVDLSEMFVVWHTYSDKAIKNVRLHGNMSFSAGGAFHDVTKVIKKYGIVPEAVYSGLNYGETKHIHGELDEVLEEQVKTIIENPNKKLSSVWHEAVNSTLDTYLGELPDKFTYEEVEYTPLSFAQDYIGLDMDNYVEITSYTHHPFYSKFILEVPDNWSWDEVYNVPLEELEEIIDNSINLGYTVAWAADVSEKGFKTSKLGVAIIPLADSLDVTDPNQGDWDEDEKESRKKKKKVLEFGSDYQEKEISQEIRQIAFDNYLTTDDHGMLIVGTAKDQKDRLYYKVKNSWGDYNDYNGFFYVSKPYVRYKTMCIMVNKEAIPKGISKKLGFE